MIISPSNCCLGRIVTYQHTAYSDRTNVTRLPSKCCLLVTWHGAFIKHLPQHYQISQQYSNIAIPLAGPGWVTAPVWGLLDNDVSWSDYVNICPPGPTVILHWDDQRQTIIFSYEYSIWTLAWSPVLSPSLDRELSRPDAGEFSSETEARSWQNQLSTQATWYRAPNYHALDWESNKQPQACLGIYQDYNESESQ